MFVIYYRALRILTALLIPFISAGEFLHLRDENVKDLGISDLR